MTKAGEQSQEIFLCDIQYQPGNFAKDSVLKNQFKYFGFELSVRNTENIL